MAQFSTPENQNSTPLSLIRDTRLEREDSDKLLFDRKVATVLERCLVLLDMSHSQFHTHKLFNHVEEYNDLLLRVSDTLQFSINAINQNHHGKL